MKRLIVRRTAGNLLLLLSALAAALALGEATMRLLSPRSIPVGGGPALYRYDTLLGWEKRPNVAVSMRAAEWDTSLRTNSLGMRGPNISQVRARGVTRILLLGDSFIEGYSVFDSETVSAQLETLLQGAGHDGAEVLNGGTAGYSTEQELLYFQEHGADLEPDVTVLFFYLNDLADNGRPTYWRGAKPYFVLSDSGLTLHGVPVPRGQWSSRELSDWLTTRSVLYRNLRDAVGRVGSRRTTRAGPPNPPREFIGFRRSMDDEAEQRWALTDALLLELRSRVEASGSEFIIFHVPSKGAVHDEVWTATRDAYGLSDHEWSPTADAERLEELCERAALECLLPAHRFRVEAPPLGSAGALYFPIDGHWTAAGHALAAKVIAEHLAGAN